MREASIGVQKDGSDICIIVTAASGGYGRGKEQTIVALDHEQAKKLRDQLDAVLSLA